MEARLLQTRISAVPYLFKVQQGIRDAVVGITYLSLPKTGDLWPRGAFPVPGNRPLPCPADEAPREIRTNTAGRPSQGPEGRRRPILAEIPTNGDTIEQILSGGRCLLYRNGHKWNVGQKERATWCLVDIRVSKGPLRAARGARLDSRCDPWQDRCLYGLAKGADKVGQAGPRLFDRVSRTPHLHHKKISPIPIGSYGCSRWVFRCKGIKAYASRLRMRGDIDLFLCGPTSLFPWSTGPHPDAPLAYPPSGGHLYKFIHNEKSGQAEFLGGILKIP